MRFERDDEDARATMGYVRNLSNGIITDEMVNDALKSLAAMRAEASRVRNSFRTKLERDVIVEYGKGLKKLSKDLLRLYRSETQLPMDVFFDPEHETYVIMDEIVPGAPFCRNTSRKIALKMNPDPPEIELVESEYNAVDVEFCNDLLAVMRKPHAIVHGDEVTIANMKRRRHSLRNFDFSAFPRLDEPEYAILPLTVKTGKVTNEIRSLSPTGPESNMLRTYRTEYPGKAPFEFWRLDEGLPSDLDIDIQNAITVGEGILRRHRLRTRQGEPVMALIGCWHGIRLIDWAFESDDNPLLQEDDVAELALLYDGTPYYDFE